MLRGIFTRVPQRCIVETENLDSEHVARVVEICGDPATLPYGYRAGDCTLTVSNVTKLAVAVDFHTRRFLHFSPVFFD